MPDATLPERGDSVTEMADSVTEMTDSVTGVANPVTRVEDPVTETAGPVTGMADSVTEAADPVTETSAPQQNQVYVDLQTRNEQSVEDLFNDEKEMIPAFSFVGRNNETDQSDHMPDVPAPTSSFVARKSENRKRKSRKRKSRKPENQEPERKFTLAQAYTEFCEKRGVFLVETDMARWRVFNVQHEAEFNNLQSFIAKCTKYFWFAVYDGQKGSLGTIPAEIVHEKHRRDGRDGVVWAFYKKENQSCLKKHLPSNPTDRLDYFQKRSQSKRLADEHSEQSSEKRRQNFDHRMDQRMYDSDASDL